jgi:hypothetical protein
MMLLNPEMTTWENLIFKAKNAMAGGGYGTLVEISAINVLKILYGLAYETKRRYNIPDPNEMRNLMMLAGHAVQLAIKAQKYEALSDVEKQNFQQEQKAIMDQWQEVKGQLPKAIEMPKDKTPAFPFPFTEGKNPLPALPALEAPRKSKAKPKVKVSSDAEYNSSLSSGNEGQDEIEMVTKRPKARAKKSAAASSSGGSYFIKGQTLRPIDERYTIGSAPALPYNDVSNDSFLIKPRTAEVVV